MPNLAIPTKGVAADAHFSDTADLPSSGTLFIGTGGNLKCTLQEMADDTFITFNNLPDGTDFPRSVKRIHTDSTVTDVILDI